MRRFLRTPKTLWGWTGLLFGTVVALLLVGNEIAIRVTTRRLQEKLKAISPNYDYDRAPVDLLGPPVDPARNAAVPLLVASDIGSRWQATLAGRHSPAAVDDPKHLGCVKDVAAFVAADPSYEASLADADRRPEYRSPAEMKRPVANVMLSHLQQYRNMVRIEVFRARGLAAAGDRGTSCQLMIRQMRLVRKWTAKEPFLISLLVGLAVRQVAVAELNRLLREGEVPATVHAAIEAEAAEEHFAVDGMRRSLGSERLFCEEMHESGRYSLLNNRMLAAWANTDKLFYLELLEQAMNAVDGPASSLDEVENRLRRSISSFNGLGRAITPATADNLPGLRNSHNAVLRSVAIERCLRIVNEATRLQLSTPVPTELKLPEIAKIDPYNEKPLRIVVTQKGLVIYSVGENLVDDGGAINSGPPPKDVGLGP